MLLLVFFVDCGSLLFNLIFYSLADFVCRIHVASCKRLTTVQVPFNKIIFRTLILLTAEGFVEGFRAIGDFILVFLRNNFLNMFMLLKDISIKSSPARR